MEYDEEDIVEEEVVLGELKESKKDKSFTTVVNRKKLNRFELDEVMV